MNTDIESLQRLSKTIERLQCAALDDDLRGLLEVVLREARDAADVRRRRLEDEQWADRLANLHGECNLVLRTLDGLECPIAQHGVRFQWLIARQCESPEDNRPIDITAEAFTYEARELRSYAFVGWRHSRRGAVAVFQEEQKEDCDPRGRRGGVCKTDALQGRTGP